MILKILLDNDGLKILYKVFLNDTLHSSFCKQIPSLIFCLIYNCPTNRSFLLFSATGQYLAEYLHATQELCL